MGEIRIGAVPHSSETENEVQNAVDDVTASEKILIKPQEAEEKDDDVVLAQTAKKHEKAFVSEDISKRGIYEKHFFMEDGSATAVIYNEPVHFINESGDMAEIDNTLIDHTEYYALSKNAFNARFSKNPNAEELIKVTRGAKSLSICLSSKEKSSGLDVSYAIVNHLSRNVMSVDSINEDSSIRYEGIRDKTDLEYVITGNKIKENIVIKERKEDYSYDFVLKSTGLVVRMSEDSKALEYVAEESSEVVFIIPAPFMYDAEGKHSDSVYYELSEKDKDSYSLKVVADASVINDGDFVFPVTVDPQIIIPTEGSLSTYYWNNGTIYSATSSTYVGNSSDSSNYCSYYRTYYKPVLPNMGINPLINKAELVLKQTGYTTGCLNNMQFGVYKVTSYFYTGSYNPANEANPTDYEAMQPTWSPSEIRLDITSIIDAWRSGETNYGLVVKALNENCACAGRITLGGPGAGNNAPKIHINYNSSYGISNEASNNVHNVGRAGKGELNLYSGALTFSHEDVAWNGNRMPANIKHVYNSLISNYNYTYNSSTSVRINSADYSAMLLGKGWKLNLQESIRPVTFYFERDEQLGFVYIDENGSELYFKFAEQRFDDGICKDFYTDIKEYGYTYNMTDRILDLGGKNYHFDESYRLIKIADGKNEQTLTYASDKLVKVTDGAGREFILEYESNYLKRIQFGTETLVEYTYADGLLTKITYQGEDGTIASGNSTRLEYHTSAYNYALKSVYNAEKISGVESSKYGITYNYSGNRVVQLEEKDGMTSGQKTVYSYNVGRNRTTSTTYYIDDADVTKTFTTVYSFDNDGRLIGNYLNSPDSGKVAVSGNSFDGINYLFGTQPQFASNVVNLLKDHNFENSSLSTYWTLDGTSGFAVHSTTEMLYGSKCLRLTSSDSAQKSVYQTYNSLPAGKYSFSSYVKINGEKISGSVFVEVKSGSTSLARSESVQYTAGEYTRIVAPFTLSSATTVTLRITIEGIGTAYIDAVQLENNEFANNYNMLQNGNFENGLTDWVSNNATYSTSTYFNMSRSLQLSGNVTSSAYAYQNVQVSKYNDVRESFTLCGWAKAFGVVDRDRYLMGDNRFALRAEIYYSDNVSGEPNYEEHSVSFASNMDEWQFASLSFEKSRFRKVNYIRVYCDYRYNTGIAYFDAIQLTRTGVQSGLSAADFAVTGGTSESEQELSPSDVQEGGTFSENMDAFDNSLTSTTFSEGKFGAFYQSFGFSEDGNDMEYETDQRNNKTRYTNDATKSLPTSVSQPGRSTVNYTYDKSNRVTSVSAAAIEGDEASAVSVGYGYNYLGNIKTISHNGFNYEMGYTGFGNLQSIGIPEHGDLVSYEYKNGNGKLKKVTYGNGMTMECSYNSIGRLIAEVWKSSGGATQASYRYVYDGAGNVVRSIDIISLIEYNYYYENGLLVKSVQSNITWSGDIVTSKTPILELINSYNSDGKIISQKVVQNGVSKSYIFEYIDDEGNFVTTLPSGAKSSSSSDHLGRREYRELQLPNGVLSEKYGYVKGAYDLSKHSGKIKSTPETSLVSSIAYANGLVLNYKYDASGNISEVRQGEQLKNRYKYDGVGRLVEDWNADTREIVSYTYDAGGNILSKTSRFYYGQEDQTIDSFAVKDTVTYTYDTVWKDKLFNITSESNPAQYGYGNFVYDTVGNPTEYRAYKFVWEKGRQLKEIRDRSSNSLLFTFKYNANGIRTYKKDHATGKEHTYFLNGTNILREVIAEGSGTATIDYFYDKDNQICGFSHTPIGGTTNNYYYYKNLQGDIISVTDANGNVVCEYLYDSWGRVYGVLGDLDVAALNPIRYRGYYYDEETNLYYLNSRYYDPEVCRFVNSDEPYVLYSHFIDLNSNHFAYCENDCINKIDKNGMNSLAIAASIPKVVAAGVGLSASTKAFLSFIWNIFVVIGLLLVIVGLALLIYYEAKKILDEVKKAIKEGRQENYRDDDEKKDPKNLKTDMVYVLTRNKELDGVFYVGRTIKFAKRYARHQATKGKFDMYVVFRCTAKQSFSWEQAVLWACVAENIFSMANIKSASPNNKRNEVSLARLKKMGQEVADLGSLLGCTFESERLYIRGE